MIYIEPDVIQDSNPMMDIQEQTYDSNDVYLIQIKEKPIKISVEFHEPKIKIFLIGKVIANMS